MSAKKSINWFWSDWAGDLAVRSLTPAERGMWIDLLTLAAVGQPTGYVCDARGDALPLEQIARFANCNLADALSLISGILAKGVASQDRSGRLFNRRMVRDAALSVKRRIAAANGGTATALKWQVYQNLPGGLLGGLPGTPGRAPFKERIINTSFGAARARDPVDNSAGSEEPPPPNFAERAKEALQREPGLGSGELSASFVAKGWVKP